MKRLKYRFLKWLGVLKYPKIKIDTPVQQHGWNINHLSIFFACQHFWVKWKEQYTQDIEYLFHGLTVTFHNNPIRANDGTDNYGVANIDSIVVWTRNGKLSDTALIHELIHYVKRALRGDVDNNHTGGEWGEGFESPVKRSLAKELLL